MFLADALALGADSAIVTRFLAVTFPMGGLDVLVVIRAATRQGNDVLKIPRFAKLDFHPTQMTNAAGSLKKR